MHVLELALPPNPVIILEHCSSEVNSRNSEVPVSKEQRGFAIPCWGLELRPWVEAEAAGFTVDGGSPMPPLSARSCWPAASCTSTLRDIPWTLGNSFDEPSSSMNDWSYSPFRDRLAGSRGSSWHRCPILRFIHRVQGRSFNSPQRKCQQTNFFVQ